MSGRQGRCSSDSGPVGAQDCQGGGHEDAAKELALAEEADDGAEEHQAQQNEGGSLLAAGPADSAVRIRPGAASDWCGCGHRVELV